MFFDFVMDKRWLIGIGILTLVVLGFFFVSTITGNVVTGSVAEEKIINEYYRIDEIEADVNDSFERGELNDEVKNG